MKKAIELSTNLIVYVIIALIVFLTLWFFFMNTTKSMETISPLYKISSLDKARQICENYCKDMKNLDSIDAMLTSDYFSRFVSIKVSFEGKTREIPVKCWWYPVNIYCESQRQIVTNNGLESITVKPFYVPDKESFDNYVYVLFGNNPNMGLCVKIDNKDLKDKEILLAQNGKEFTSTLQNLKEEIDNIRRSSSYDNQYKYKVIFEYLGELAIAANDNIINAYKVEKIKSIDAACP